MAFRSLRHTLAALLVLLSLATGAAAGVQVRVTPASTTAAAGSTITLTIEADAVTDLGGFQFGFNYNPANLQAVSTTINPAFDQVVAQNLGSGNGLIAATVFNNAPVSGTPLTLATIDFTVLTAVTSSVSLANVILGQLGGAEIPSTASGATIIADAFTISATAGSGGSISPAGITTLSLGGSQSYAITANSGYHVVDVKVDTISQGAISGYAFNSINASHTIDATFAPDPVNGACGTSSGSAFNTAPGSNLCAAGSATVVSGTGPWSWSCNGSNGGSTANCSAAIDITGPTLTVSTLANGAITNNATLNVSGTVLDASGVAALIINNATVTVTGGSFSYPVTLQAGANTITTIATDTLGNSTTDTRTITLDTTAPVLTISAPADNSKTAQTLAIITGTVNETSNVTVTVNNGTPQSASITGSTYSASVNLAVGLNTITITATDLAINTTSAVRSVIYDNTNPSLAITSPNQDITTGQNSITITGTVSDTITSATVTVIFDNQTYTPTITNGIFSQQLTIPAEGTYTITAAAADEAGNSSSVTRNVIYAIPVNGVCGTSNGGTFDMAPATNLCSTGSAATVTGTGPWTWSCSGSNGGSTASCSAGIQTYAIAFQSIGNGTLTGSTSQTVNYGGSTTTVTAVPAPGYHFINWTEGATVVDTTAALTISNVTAAHSYTANFVADPVNGVCGSSNGGTFKLAPTTNLCNTGSAATVTGSGPWSWSCSGNNGGSTANCSAAIDITGPTLIVSTLANGAITNNATINVSGTVLDASGVTGLTINNATVTFTGGSFSYPVTLQAGANTITTIATDTLGNSTTDTRTITLDTTAPVLTISAPADNSKTAQPLAIITGTVNETSTASVALNNGTPQSASMTGTGYNATVSLAVGLNNIAITATDLAGNMTSASRTITYDNTNPSLAITDPIQDIATAQNSLTIVGTVSDTITPAAVSINFNSQTLIPEVTSGTFSQLLTCPSEGTWQVIVTAFDEAGNSSTVVRNIIYQVPVNGSCGISNNASLATAPTIGLCSAGTASAVTGTGPWSWSCSGTNGGTSTGCSTGDYIYTITAVANAGGTITPAGTTRINMGANQSYTITPDSGYLVADVKIDDISKGALSTYTFSNVTVSHSIEVLFSRPDGVMDPANTTGVPGMIDALIALSFAMGEAVPTPEQLRCADTSPVMNGVPHPDGKIDLGDVLVTLRRAVGLTRW